MPSAPPDMRAVMILKGSRPASATHMAQVLFKLIYHRPAICAAHCGFAQPGRRSGDGSTTPLMRCSCRTAGRFRRALGRFPLRGVDHGRGQQDVGGGPGFPDIVGELCAEALFQRPQQRRADRVVNAPPSRRIPRGGRPGPATAGTIRSRLLRPRTATAIISMSFWPCAFISPLKSGRRLGSNSNSRV